MKADEVIDVEADLVQLVRLALAEQAEDVRLFVARLVRKYRSSNPELAGQLDSFLRARPARNGGPLRRATKLEVADQVFPMDDESRLSLLRAFKDDPDREMPLLEPALEETLHQLIQERKQSDRLATLGLHPARSAIFVGPPGVGKTLTARWIAAQLQVPLYILDLTAVMSSFLGRSGSNLRSALDFAKRTPCVLLLDEIDAIAKRRSDEADVGELKRLVTVILQEVDQWPPAGLLLAATNHPELIDRALWRRFDLVLDFKLPELAAVRAAVNRFLGPDARAFECWTDILTFALNGESFSDIERALQRLRRALALRRATAAELVEEFVRPRLLALSRQERIDMAVLLARHTRLSQHTIADVTGVSRDTIRKYAKNTRARKEDARA